MTGLSRELGDIADALIAAVETRHVVSQLDYLVERLEAAAERAAALETTPHPDCARLPARRGPAEVIDFCTRERLR